MSPFVKANKHNAGKQHHWVQLHSIVDEQSLNKNEVCLYYRVEEERLKQAVRYLYIVE